MKFRHYLTAAITASLVLAWGLFLAVPMDRKIHNIRDNISQGEKQLDDFHRIMAGLPEFYKSRNEMDERKSRLMSKLIPKKDVMKLFDLIEKMARKNGVTVKEITPSVEELLVLNRQLPDDNRPQILEVGLKLEGTIPQVGQLIKSIEAENFYKGLTFCRIYNHLSDHPGSDIHYGFKAILGTIKEI
jgi:hypothetical protein